MPVLCVESGITYATGVALVAAEGGANRTAQVSGSVSFATSVNSSQYNLGIVIIPNPGEETQDDGDINIGAQMTGAFSCSAPNSEIRNLRTNNLNLTSAPNMTIDGLICDGLGSDGVIYNDTVNIGKLIIHNANDSLISSATRPNSNITNVTSVGATRFGFANGKFNNCVDINSANQGYFGEMSGSGNLWEHDGSGTNTITESPVTDVFVDYAAGKYGILSTSGPGAANAGGFIFTASSGVPVPGLLNSNYMVEYSMKKNVTGQSVGAQMITIADGSDFTGTVTAEVTVDGGTKTAGGGTVTHEGEGYHSYAPTQAETNGDHIAFSFSGTGALTSTIQVYTNFPQTTDHTTPLATIDFTVNSILIDTDDLQKNQGDWLTATGFNTVVPPSVAQFDARTIPSDDYFVVTDYTAPDNASITSILADTNELQLNQGNWLTATGFSTLVATDIVTGGAITTSAGIASADINKINGVTITGNGSGSPFDV